MSLELNELENLQDLHEAAGKAVFDACGAEIFPCDALAFAILDRSLGLLKGFRLLISGGAYSSAMALLRMQLDNILRLYGVVSSNDAHDYAYRIARGEHLRNLKDRTGKKMSDKHLVETLTKSAPWLPEVYDLCSGYVHFSGMHIAYFLGRTTSDKKGQRMVAIGDDDEHVPDIAKQRLINAFVAATRGVTKLVSGWSEIRELHGANQTLKSKYPAGE